MGELVAYGFGVGFGLGVGVTSGVVFALAAFEAAQRAFREREQ